MMISLIVFKYVKSDVALTTLNLCFSISGLVELLNNIFLGSNKIINIIISLTYINIWIRFYVSTCSINISCIKKRFPNSWAFKSFTIGSWSKFLYSLKKLSSDLYSIEYFLCSPLPISSIKFISKSFAWILPAAVDHLSALWECLNFQTSGSLKRFFVKVAISIINLIIHLLIQSLHNYFVMESC